MNIRPETWLPALARLAAVVLLGGLVLACGPGGGGTGTGPVNGIASFSGSVGTTFGSALSVGLPCTTDCPAVSLRLENDHVAFSAPCRRFTHEGPWSIDSAGLATLDGSLETETVTNGQHGKTTSAALLRLQFSEGSADSRQVTVTVRDAQGRSILPSLSLQRSDTGASAATAAVCGD